MLGVLVPHSGSADARADLLPARIWLGWLDSNQRMLGSKPSALPLGDTPTTCVSRTHEASYSLFERRILHRL